MRFKIWFTLEIPISSSVQPGERDRLEGGQVSSNLLAADEVRDLVRLLGGDSGPISEVSRVHPAPLRPVGQLRNALDRAVDTPVDDSYGMRQDEAGLARIRHATRPPLPVR